VPPPNRDARPGTGETGDQDRCATRKVPSDRQDADRMPPTRVGVRSSNRSLRCRPNSARSGLYGVCTGRSRSCRRWPTPGASETQGKDSRSYRSSALTSSLRRLGHNIPRCRWNSSNSPTSRRTESASGRETQLPTWRARSPNRATRSWEGRCTAATRSGGPRTSVSGRHPPRKTRTRRGSNTSLADWWTP